MRRLFALIVVFALGVGATLLYLDRPEATAEIRFEPASATGQDPFIVMGAGPFGGSGDNEVCDPELLIRSLQARPDRLAEWARVLGIEPQAMPEFVRSLRPMVLAQDTTVINHGFRNGKAYGFRAVLEAGTAVLADASGRPVVRCRCGNPLKDPPKRDPDPTPTPQDTPTPTPTDPPQRTPRPRPTPTPPGDLTNPDPTPRPRPTPTPPGDLANPNATPTPTPVPHNPNGVTMAPCCPPESPK